MFKILMGILEYDALHVVSLSTTSLSFLCLIIANLKMYKIKNKEQIDPDPNKILQ